ncbi:MAG: peptidoglycan DD-metalloendopeptidase family protein [Prevotella sp.]|nr:peptidoglycan DD-metalloendopeptidase family protein [Prevotella sp.]
MKRFGLLFLFVASFALAPYAQQKNAAKPKAKAQPAAKPQAKKPVAAQSKGKKPAAQQPKKPAAKGKGAAQQPVTVKGLQNQRAVLQRKIQEQERRLRTNERDVRQRLQSLMMLNTEIEGKRRVIDTIRRDISSLDVEIEMLNSQLAVLNQELADRKQKYVKSMRYMHRNRSLHNQLFFIFSAKNFSQMYRRLRFMREYASYQRAQGEEVKGKVALVKAKHTELLAAKQEKDRLLAQGERERRSLEGKQVEQQNVVTTLQREQRTIQGIIAQQKQKDAALNAQIDRMIAEEVAAAKARAAAEARRRAQAAEAKRRKAELARRRAEAEAAARASAQRIADAKAREQRARAAAASAKTSQQRAAAEAEARQAEQARRQVEQQAASDARQHAQEVASARRASEADNVAVNTEDLRISGNFESNRGRLPMPIIGSYRIVSHFGQYNVEGLTNVTLDNKGINIKGQSGAQVRSIFDGEVSRVFSFGGTMGVMVRHGSYISVYCNLASVSVHRGQKVKLGQAIGRVGPEDILQFQLRKETAKLNPESWLGR